ncbi:histidine phosphatase family protein [Rhodospirillaceae bacterium SYSU D60014]|uniref:histidine phosphatase family protein n=1 Tax=Virgifigura deserti TaxID=2268457 RepID=UPI000E675CFB
MILIRHGQSEFNIAFDATRIDPGIPDPKLTDKGRRQARAVAEALRDERIERLIVSPYTRTLETATAIAERLSLPITIEPLVRERAFFVCDIGSPRAELTLTWPRYRFDHLEECWWPNEESETELLDRCARFRAAMAATADWRRVAVVTHWGFIRGLTGHEAENCEMIRFDPVAGRIDPQIDDICGIEPPPDP